MHPTQKAILELARCRNIGKMSLREVAESIGAKPAPQIIKYHMDQLEDAGFLKIDRKAKISEVISPGLGSGLASLPIVGSANCGPATIFADHNVDGYLQVSQSVVDGRPKDFFVIRAEGNSMSGACVKGQAIEDGDYVVVDGKDRIADDGKYVVAILGDVANIKKIHFDEESKTLALLSESKSQDAFPPIYIDQDDEDVFHVAGRVVRVLKNPKV